MQTMLHYLYYSRVLLFDIPIFFFFDNIIGITLIAFFFL